MMASMAQAYSPHPAGLQHPGVGPGHPMGPGHPQQGGGQAGPGMSQQIHMGVSGPGPQVTQAGAMLGMPLGGVAGPGVPSAHALQHLNPQAQIYQQQQQAQMGYGTPQMQMQHQQVIQQHRAAAARNALMAQQYNGVMPMGMPNGIPPQMNPAQYAAIRGGPNMRPVPLPQHLQQQQQQAQLGAMAQEQAQQQAQQQQHQQQQLMVQQLAMQQANAAAAQANNAGQPNPMAPQQIQNIQNAQLQAAQQQQQQQAQQQQAQQQAQAAATQQPQPTGQAQPQAQQAQQPQPQTPQPQPAQQQQQVPASAMMQTRPREQIKGHCILKLGQFGEYLSQFVATKQREDLAYWAEFVEKFFSSRGVLRHSVWDTVENSSKQYEVTFPALARYFFTHFESGIVNIQMIADKTTEKELANNCHYIECQKSSFIYWFDHGSQLVANGHLRAQFDANQKIELLEFVTNSHEEYVPRRAMLEAARPLHEWQKDWQKANPPTDAKQSPEMSKKKNKQLKSPPTAPPEIGIPESKVKGAMGITPSVFRFLEIAEVLGQMNPLFNFSHQHINLTPYAALDQYVQNITLQQASQGMLQPGQRTPSMGQFPMGQSPSAAHLGLPEAIIGGSPAQGSMQAPGMALQQSQQGTSSSGPSANTSPNVSNKRRRASVKTEGEDAAQANGVQPKVRPSPRMGSKKQKGNAA